ncbi:MAG: hypothetical protein HRF40_00810 [Nitrososphaera sp.]
MIILGVPVIAVGVLVEIRGMIEMGKIIQYAGFAAVIAFIALSLPYLFSKRD